MYTKTFSAKIAVCTQTVDAQQRTQTVGAYQRTHNVDVQQCTQPVGVKQCTQIMIEQQRKHTVGA